MAELWAGLESQPCSSPASVSQGRCAGPAATAISQGSKGFLLGIQNGGMPIFTCSFMKCLPCFIKGLLLLLWNKKSLWLRWDEQTAHWASLAKTRDGSNPRLKISTEKCLIGILWGSFLAWWARFGAHFVLLFAVKFSGWELCESTDRVLCSLLTES